MTQRGGARKGGGRSRGDLSKKAESAGAEDRKRQKDRGTVVRGGGERQKGEGAECMEIQSHAIQL